MILSLFSLVAFGLFFTLFLLVAVSFRTVVATNSVHIVQSAKRTISYGKDQSAGNTYYAWPSWLPIWGVKVIPLPVSVFKLNLNAYDAYDKGRVPFVIDILAFFCIDDTNTAAQRVSSFAELKEQLEGILQGASRSILAKSEIEEILEERNKFGQMFTDAISEQLKQWGVRNVKTVELMDIRDDRDSKVISNIMAKKKSEIERQSRTVVAANMQQAQQAEIDAQREVQLRQQEAAEQVGRRTADREKQVGISSEQAKQAVKEQEKETALRQMAVTSVQQVRGAEIQRDVKIVEAQQAKATSVIKAEGEAAAAIAAAEGSKKQTVLVAEGNLAQAQLSAQGIEAQGRAKGAAETAVLMAPVTAQITLAKEIGENQGYQQYLVTLRRVEAEQVVGVAKADAIKAAEIKVIANAGNVAEGLNSVMDILTPKGATTMGAAVEAFANTDMGKKVLNRLGVKTEEPKPSTGNGASH